MTSNFDAFKHLTRARIALGRAGDGLPTGALLDFTLAHALARDAIHGEVDWGALQLALRPNGTITP